MDRERFDREKFYALCQAMMRGDMAAARPLAAELGIAYGALREIFPRRGGKGALTAAWAALCRRFGPLGHVATALGNVRDANSVRRVFHAAYPAETAREVFAKGDHIAVHRQRYSHHGIYDGAGGVYEYNERVVRHVPLEDFARGDAVYRVADAVRYAPEQVIERAKSRLSEQAYHVLWNNCENFAAWCRSGAPL